eukprot:GHRR01023066.1.p1 GENE.GHRR01023066.1~~GHRR01023066.1.p1  ORF type:complete len:604 (+),score=189.04 GHRR01023066.1:381-2192(+)
MQQLQTGSDLQQHVKGVLIDDTDPPDSYSSLGPFPGAEYAPYAQKAYLWNPAGAANNGLVPARAWFPVPFFLLTPELALAAQQRAAHNALQGYKQKKQYHARLKLAMTSSGKSNSSACIWAGTCKPLGGYSVWSAIPPLPAIAAAGDANRPIILVVAQTDSIDQFHDSIQGADASLSSLMVLLAALNILQGTNAAASYTKRVVFLALAGETWDYMGSRRLLYEASLGSNSTAGVDMSLIEQVIEVGQVGRLSGPPDRLSKLHAHSQKGAGFGNTISMIAALTAAAAEEASVAQVDVQAAHASNPGIPPSSLMSFLRINPSIQGLVLTEFDQAFTNPYYASRFDNGSTINAAGVASTAAVLAAAVHRLAGGDPTALKLNMTVVGQVISDYMSCILIPAPGYACPLAQAIMTPDYTYDTATSARNYAPKQYIGVLQVVPPSDQLLQSPWGKSNLARFVWNLMALGSSSSGQAECDPFEQTCSAGQVCAGWRGNSVGYMGKCVNATVKYVPSYSTQFMSAACDDPYQAKWQVTDAADAWHQQYNWPADPMWTESDWPLGVPVLQLYLHEARAVEMAVLAAGLVVTAAVAAASFIAQTAFERHVKRS